MLDDEEARQYCGDTGGVTVHGAPCKSWAHLDGDGRCRHHPIPGDGEDTPRAIEARTIANEERCLELRRTGMSLRQIAQNVDMHHSGVALALKRAISRHRELTAETAHEVMELELQRLDEMQMRVWPDVLSRADSVKQHRAIQSVLRIMDRRAALLGLDKFQVEFSGEVNSSVDFNVSVTGVDLSVMTEDDLATLELLLRKYGERGEVIDVTPTPDREAS